MRFEQRSPSPALAAVVSRFWQVEGHPGGEEQIVPDGRTEIVFHLHPTPERDDGDGAVYQPPAMLAGQIDQALTLRMPVGLAAFGITLRPEASGLARIPAADLAGRFEAIEDLFGAGAARWRDRIEHARGFDHRVSISETYLAALVPAADPRVRAACQHLSLGASIDRAAAQAEIGRRQLERLFLRQVGVEPKRYARIVRFQRALRARQSGLAWAEVALEAGYYDQSHLIADYRVFAGRTPASLTLTPFSHALTA